MSCPGRPVSERLSPKQTAVLRDLCDGRRVGVVRAGPGSGKTRVFAELFRHELQSWRSKPGGIAALSFTNVAQREIAERLQHSPTGPHFVGTLDSFLWRYLVRPFGHLAGVTNSGAILIPAPLDQVLDGPTTRFGPTAKDTESIFRISILGGDEATPGMVRRDRFLGSVALSNQYRTLAIEQKRRNWKSTGQITHSDCQYLASALLRGASGNHIASLLARRFPLVLVDEFQDTGWFLGRAFLRLLESPSIRGVLVGDPDQAIYQFGGAHRTLFDQAEQLEPQAALTLHESHRCSFRICRVASAVARSGQALSPVPDAPDGDAVLLQHWQGRSQVSLAPILEAVEDLLVKCESIGVLARKTETVRRLKAQTDLEACPWRSGVGRRLSVAVEQVLAGDFPHARRLVERELVTVVFHRSKSIAHALQENNIAPERWRHATGHLLLDLAETRPKETWNEWIDRVEATFLAGATALGFSPTKAAFAAHFKRHKNGDSIRAEMKSPAASSLPKGTEILTVHQAKGRTFDAIVFYVPQTAGPATTCPSDDWWSQQSGSEEQEVAFVAFSRARRVLVVAAHGDICANLRAKRSTFHDLFQEREVGQPPKSRRKENGVAGKRRTEPTQQLDLLSVVGKRG